MRMRLGKRKPIGFRFLCWVPFIEVFPHAGWQPSGAKKSVAGQGDRAIGNDLIPFGLSADYSGFGGAGHQLFSGCEHRL
jgi:hypothetical protein